MGLNAEDDENDVQNEVHQKLWGRRKNVRREKKQKEEERSYEEQEAM